MTFACLLGNAGGTRALSSLDAGLRQKGWGGYMQEKNDNVGWLGVPLLMDNLKNIKKWLPIL